MVTSDLKVTVCIVTEGCSSGRGLQTPASSLTPHSLLTAGHDRTLGQRRGSSWWPGLEAGSEGGQLVRLCTSRFMITT